MDYNYLTGIGKRELNEDVVLIEEINQSTNLFLVVDGMGGYRDWETIIIHQDRKSTRLNSSHSGESRMPSSA